MTKSLEWFREIFENIRVDVDRSGHLEELQISTGASNTSDLVSIVPNLQLNIIFDCLNTSDKTQLEQAISIIKKFLAVLNSVDVVKLYGTPLGRALEHPDVQAKELVLNELNRAASNVDLLTIICQEVSLLASVIECIKSETLSLASAASQFLNELGKIQPGIAVLFNPPLLNHLKNLASTDDTVKLRVYQIIVDISVHSINGLHASIESNILLDLLNDVQSNDILVQLSSLETVTKLALTNHGLQFLKEKGFLHYIEQQLKDFNGVNSLLLPGFIKFFGNVTQTRPREIFTEFPTVTNVVFELYDSNDPVLSNLALETIGFVASTPDGKLALNQHDVRMRSAVHHLGKMIALQPSERKVVALNVFTNILQLSIINQNSELLNITKKWFSQLSDHPIKTIVSVCEKPFFELKLAGLALLNAVAEQPWGQEEICTCPGLVEYLLNRNEEGDMNCKAAKYKIVKTIFDSPFSRNVFPSVTIRRFQLHIKQGIVYVQTKTEVAMESAG